MKRINTRYAGRNNHLKRLPAEHYRGQAYVHWSMTVEDRRTGWLTPAMHFRFREVLTHAMFRFGLCCPIYCCMPDHFHLLWIGLFEESDQLLAARFVRKHVDEALATLDVELQQQAYDHVLREEERNRNAFEEVAEYIARNPERAGLVPVDRFAEYRYTSCLIPGYPELSPWQPDYWSRFWRTYAWLATNGLTRRARA